MEFIKAQANGNDFIIVKREEFIGYDPVDLCDRHYGIGADGILIWEKNDHYWMDVINADGSESDICVNGLRAFGLYLMDSENCNSIEINTRAGMNRIEKTDDLVDAVISIPEANETVYKIEVGNRLFDVHYYKMNNSHGIILYDFNDRDFFQYADIIKDKLNANISFVKEVGDRYYAMVWEKGVGHTLSCGSAAICIFYHLEHTLDIGDAEIEMAGGIYKIRREGKAIRLRGNAGIVFKGNI